MLIITQTALELGFLYALVAMALFLSYRILDIADLTTDGCFVLGAAVSVTVTAAGHPVLAIFAAMLAGACAGFVTAFLQTKLGVPSILAGIVTNTGLYTVNLMAMGWKSNQSLLGGKTVFTMLRETGIGGECTSCCSQRSSRSWPVFCWCCFSARAWVFPSAPRAITPTWCAPRP